MDNPNKLHVGVAVLAGILGTVAAQHGISPAHASMRADFVRFLPDGAITVSIDKGVRARAGITVTPTGIIEVNGKTSADGHAKKIADAVTACAKVVTVEVPAMSAELAQ